MQVLKSRVRKDADFKPAFSEKSAPTDKDFALLMGIVKDAENAFSERATPHTIKRTVGILLSSFKVAKANTSPEDLTHAFIMGLDDVSQNALMEAVKRVAKGEASIRDHDGNARKLSPTFLPTPAELRMVAVEIETTAKRPSSEILKLLELPISKHGLITAVSQ